MMQPQLATKLNSFFPHPRLGPEKFNFDSISIGPHNRRMDLVPIFTGNSNTWLNLPVTRILRRVARAKWNGFDRQEAGGWRLEN